MTKLLLYVFACAGAVAAAIILAASVGVGYLVIYYGMQPVQCIKLDSGHDTKTI